MKISDWFHVTDGTEEDMTGRKYPKFRLSEAMSVNATALIISLLIGFGIEEAQAAAIATGAMAVLGLLLRLRSTGGEVKVKREL